MSAKKRTRRTTKFQRAIQGATLENIMAKKNQKPEVRKAQREQAIRLAKLNFLFYTIFFNHLDVQQWDFNAYDLYINFSKA